MFFVLSKVYSAVLVGIDAQLVKVEVDIPSYGFPGWNMVGLLETAVKEAKERVAAAIRNSGYQIINRKTIINLAPGHIKKSGVHFDLPIAIGLLAAWGIIRPADAKRYLYAGELSLTGQVLPVAGTLVMTLAARDKKFDGIIISDGNIREANMVDGVDVIGINSLAEAVEFLNTKNRPTQKQLVEASCEKNSLLDFSDVRGQESAKRALEIAAAGGHNVLMTGPPGTGKTMLAERMSGILPPLTQSEMIETLKVFSVHGIINDSFNLTSERPFRAPHHSASYAGLVGGGGGGATPRIGEISLAHNGVLFLDEMPEFRKDALEVLRQPLESGAVRIVRMGTSVVYPARFMLVAAMNPCRCGYYGDKRKACICTISQIQSYRTKISGPLLDRIDLHINVPPLTHDELLERGGAEPSSLIRQRVIAARERQKARYSEKISCNAELKGRQIQEYCAIGLEEKKYLKAVSEKTLLSARAVHRILKVARTIADLDEKDVIKTEHLAQAVHYRPMDRNTL